MTSVLTDEERANLRAAVPHLRLAIAMASEPGVTVRLGVVAERDGGGGRVTATLDVAIFESLGRLLDALDAAESARQQAERERDAAEKVIEAARAEVDVGGSIRCDQSCIRPEGAGDTSVLHGRYCRRGTILASLAVWDARKAEPPEGEPRVGGDAGKGAR